MERPSWAPVILSGALPREQQVNQSGWFATLLGLVPLTCALAALSNSSRTQREELALFAYGGAGWQIQLRYVVRGCVVAIVGLLPIWLRFLTTENIFSANLVLLLASALVGGLAYGAPALKRTRSLAFVEQYKG